MPSIGIPVSFINVTVSSKVPSPPRLIMQSIEESMSADELKVEYFPSKLIAH